MNIIFEIQQQHLPVVTSHMQSLMGRYHGSAKLPSFPDAHGWPWTNRASESVHQSTSHQLWAMQRQMQDSVGANLAHPASVHTNSKVRLRSMYYVLVASREMVLSLTRDC